MRIGVLKGRAFTLLEVLLSIGLLMALFSLALPDLLRDIESRRLPESARQMRSLLMLLRANAMYDGKRYRIRFPQEDEIDSEGAQRQPLIEREDDPFLDPGIYNLVTEPWARGATLLRGIRCAKVRLGRPTLDRLEDEQAAEQLEDEEEEFLIGELIDEYDEGMPPLFIETDGTSEWATFVVTDAPAGAEEDELEDYLRIEVILDGITGLIWLQRPFYEDELELFREHEWPPVLRRDFLRLQPLTEEQVLEIQETRVRR